MTGLRLLLLVMLSTPAAAAPYFVQCFDFGCKTTQEVHFDESHWREIRALFGRSDLTADEEKQAIRHAVAAMERISGEITGTYRDKAGNYPGQDLIRQMDCIDESTNTLQYLLALETLDLLQHHRVDRKHHRIVWFISHWTAAIVDLADNRRFAIDSWYRDNGELPLIQPLEDWARKRDWPRRYNPELGDD